MSLLKMQNIKMFFLLGVYFIINSCIIFAEEQISSFKLENFDRPPHYEIPNSSRFTVSRPDNSQPEIIYYLSKPNIEQNKKIPITIFVTGSASKNYLHSVIHVHRYFLAEVLGVGSAMITLEQWGVDNDKINEQEFFEHYTLSQRYEDHSQVIKYLKANPPDWWNGGVILIGISEGGRIVTRLAGEFNDIIIATVNWVGAGDWNWRDELYKFVETQQKFEPLKYKIQRFFYDWWEGRGLNTNRQNYDLLMDHILLNPNANEEFVQMTYKYHADAMEFPAPEYQKISKPFLVVAGALDTNANIQSTEDFAKKAKAAGVNITYIKVPDMDHYIRKRPDIIDQSFKWLKDQLSL